MPRRGAGALGGSICMAVWSLDALVDSLLGFVDDAYDGSLSSIV